MPTLRKLSRAGPGADQIQVFLPRALEHLRDLLPADVVDRIKDLIPAATAPAGGVAH